MKPIPAILAALAMGVVAASAGTVTLKNGDRITGDLESMFQGKLLLKTAYAGELALDWGEVVAFSSDEPLTLFLNSGQAVKGAVLDLSGGWLAVRTDQGVLTVALPMIVGINEAPKRANAEEVRPVGAAAGASAAPTRAHSQAGGWTGTLSLGPLIAWGNTQDLGGSGRLEVARSGAWGRFTGGLSMLYARDAGVRTGDEQILDVRWERDLRRAAYTFVEASSERDPEEELRLRAIVAAGVGRGLLAGRRFDVSGDIGVALERAEPTSGDGRTGLDGYLGLRTRATLPGGSRLSGAVRAFPTAREGGGFRVTERLEVETPLASRLFFDAALLGQQNSLPEPGVGKNDFQVRVGIALAF